MTKGKPLTKELKAQIVTEFNDSGETMKNIAAKFNVSLTAVGNTLSEYFESKHPGEGQEFDHWVETIEKEAEKIEKAFGSLDSFLSIFKRR